MSATIPGADDDGPGYGFTRADTARIRRTVLRTEGYYLNRAPARGRGPVAAGPSLVPVTLTAALAAGSPSSPTSANCTVMVAKSPGPGFTTTGGRTDTIYNPYSKASFTSGQFCWGQYRGKFLYLFVGDC